MNHYDEIRQDLKGAPLATLKHQLSCAEGEYRAGKRTGRLDARIAATRDEIDSRSTIEIKAEIKPAPSGIINDQESPIEYRASIKYQQLFESAQRRGKEFNLSFFDVKKLLQRKTCAYTGNRLSSNPKSPDYRTIDRLDPSLGYVKGNVFAVGARANKMKNHLFEETGGNYRMPLGDLLKMCAAIARMGFSERDI